MATMPADHVNARTNERTGSSAWLGTLLMLLFLGILACEVVDRAIGLPFSMPASWYAARGQWYAVALAALGGGCWILGRRVSEADWTPSQPGRRFGAIVLFTRSDCGLCDEAHAVLIRYRRWLPPLEIVDVDTDPLLVKRYGETVPVVEIDGVPRFKGRVNEFALRRLIEGTSPA